MSSGTEQLDQLLEAVTAPTAPTPRHNPDNPDLFDYLALIWKWRRLVFGMAIGSMVVAAVVSLVMPKIYEATATILPPVQSGQGGMGTAAAAAAAAAAVQAQTLGIWFPTTPATPIDLFLAMLNSQTIAAELVKQHNLTAYFESENEEEVIKALKGSTKIATTVEKVITVTVEAQNPQLAADLANGFVSELDKLNRSLAVGKASQHRRFIERRLAEGQADLAEAETKLAEFQTRNKAVALPEQASAAIKAAAEVQARISATEVHMEVLQTYLAPENPEMLRLKSEQAELKRQLHLLESGKEGKGMLPGDRLHPAFITVPSLGMEYAKLLRDVKVQEMVFAMLTNQFEQAKIEEMRDTPTVQILDRAKPPARKSKPKIKQNMMIAGLLGMFTGIFIAYVIEAFRRRRSRTSGLPAVL